MGPKNQKAACKPWAGIKRCWLLKCLGGKQSPCFALHFQPPPHPQRARWTAHQGKKGQRRGWVEPSGPRAHPGPLNGGSGAWLGRKVCARGGKARSTHPGGVQGPVLCTVPVTGMTRFGQGLQTLPLRLFIADIPQHQNSAGLLLKNELLAPIQRALEALLMPIS